MAKKKTLRVAVVHAEVLPIPPVLGGAIGQIVYETVQDMPEIAWTVISRWDEALQNVETDARFRYVDINARLAMVKDILGKQAKRMLSGRALKQFCYIDGVASVLQDCDVDVIQVENRPQFVPYLKKRFPNTKFILYVHNEADYADMRVRQGVDLCDALVFVSDYLARQYEAVFPGVHEKSVVVHNSVNTAFWHPKYKVGQEAQDLRIRYGVKEGATVLFVGRTVPEKGLHHLVDAMKFVNEKIPLAHLFVVGSPLFGGQADSQYMQEVKKQACDLRGRVTFVGFVRPDELRCYYAISDVVVVPSNWAEPFGKVIVEAMSMAVPVIGSRRGGIPEIIEHTKSGVLIDNPEDASGLADQILNILKSKKAYLNMGTEGRKVVEAHFTPEMKHQKLQRVYNRVV